MSKRVLIIGASSAIAKATARQLAHDKASFFLVARNAEKLTTLSNDLLVRGAANVDTLQCDLADISTHEKILSSTKESLGQIDIVLIAHGLLPDQEACQKDFKKVQEVFDVNAMSVMSLGTILANELEQQKSGTIAVISSVAGDRGRKSNYVYGTTKAAVSTFFRRPTVQTSRQRRQRPHHQTRLYRDSHDRRLQKRRLIMGPTRNRRC